MAALGKIRSKGKILAIIIGLALFAFIAEELFRSCESTRNDQRQQIGKILGHRVSVQEFQALFDEYQEVMKLQRGTESLTEEESNQAKDWVWNSLIQSRILENETQKLGLTVTDQEMQDVLNEGTNPMLRQTPFVDQQTGRFDANQLKKFLAEYKAQQTANPQLAEQYRTLYHFWTFVEKNLRQQLLAQKYQALFSHCLLTNPVECKAAFEASNEEADIQLAAFAYNDVNDSKISISDADMKKKYDEIKETFRQYVETRNVKYIDIQVDASAADRAELQAQFDGYAAELADAADPSDIVRKSTSLVGYLGLPVKKNAFPADISAMIDSLAVGQTSQVFETKRDNTLNVMKVISKESLPDSVEYRQIQVAADTPEQSRAKADSIFNALNNGADFELVAKNYGQTGETIWLTTSQYQSSPSLDANTRTYLETLNTLAPGEIKNLELDQINIVVQVVSRRAFIDKYVVAAVKKTIDFSHETYSAAYNKFAAFVSTNRTGEDIVKNAEGSGYTVSEYSDLTTAAHDIANIHGTREALKWVFDAKESAVSPMYECGENNHLLVVVLDKINKKGYRGLDDAQVADFIKAELTKDKKAEVILADLSGVKSVKDAAAKGGKTAPIKSITFATPAFVPLTGTAEAALSGAVASTPRGKFCSKPVKGEGGVYVYQVVNKTQRDGKYDAAKMKAQMKQKAMQATGSYMNELRTNADVTDNRYIFF